MFLPYSATSTALPTNSPLSVSLFFSMFLLDFFPSLHFSPHFLSLLPILHFSGRVVPLQPIQRRQRCNGGSPTPDLCQILRKWQLCVVVVEAAEKPKKKEGSNKSRKSGLDKLFRARTSLLRSFETQCVGCELARTRYWALTSLPGSNKPLELDWVSVCRTNSLRLFSSNNGYTSYNFQFVTSIYILLR